MKFRKSLRIVTSLYTFVLVALSAYHIFFTAIAFRVEQEAIAYATDEKGKFSFDAKKEFLQRKLKGEKDEETGEFKPIPEVVIFGVKYTYEDALAKRVSLDLSLSGGAHFTLQIDHAAVIRNLLFDEEDDFMNEVLKEASRRYTDKSNRDKTFVTCFGEVYSEQSIVPLQNHIDWSHINAENELSFKQNLALLEKEMQMVIDMTIKVISQRLNPNNTSEIVITKGNLDKIKVAVPGATSEEQVIKFLDRGKLTFHSAVLDNSLVAQFFTEAQGLKDEETGRQFGDICHNSGGMLVALSDDVDAVFRVLSSEAAIFMLPKGYRFIKHGKESMKGESQYVRISLIKSPKDGEGVMDGDRCVTNAKTTRDQRDGGWAVAITLNEMGRGVMKELSAKNLNRAIAIVFNEEIHSMPGVKNVLDTTVFTISGGGMSFEDAQQLATVINSGGLPVDLQVIEKQIVGPSLGEAAQKAGFWAILIGFILILLFMIAYYGTGGLIAIFALLLNGLFIFGGLAQLHTSLSMAGIAGFLLTMGMSVDANVLIIERIREELRKGKAISVRQAIQMGYSKAFSSILDGNITTLLTGFVLWYFGVGPLKGFAITLILGLVSSFFTSVFLTRLLIGNRQPSFSFLLGQNLLTGFNIDFLKNRVKTYGFTLFFIFSGVVYMFIGGGIARGIEFTGGRSYVVQFSAPIQPEKVRTILEGVFDQSPEVVTYGNNNTVRITTSYKVDQPGREVDQQIEKELLQAIATETLFNPVATTASLSDSTFRLESSSKIGSSVAGDMVWSAIIAILLALLSLFGYIFYRFKKLHMALAAVIALLSDVVVIFSALALSKLLGMHYEINLDFVAALLTTLGYSINDTVVVFDRIRETVKGVNSRDRVKMNRLVNRAINDTLSRTLITSITTGMPVGALFVCSLLGAEVLGGFSFVLLVGVIQGTCSSIGIAAPLSQDLLPLIDKVKGWVQYKKR